MAKKFVRGITDIKNIEHQDFDTNNVNDLLSDGKHNYIHRKKNDGSEEYHNLTNNIKTIESSNTSLLSVTNFNNSTNSAKLTPKHDRRKEQLLESTDETILITHGENGTDETTNVDVNFDKVQAKLTANASIGVDGTGLRQLYTNKETYTHANATLKTHVKSVSQNTSISTVEEEFNFLAKMNKSQTTATFSLSEHDTAVFEYLIDTYGVDGSVNISGCAFSLSNSTLTFNCNSATYNPYIVTFSDIIPTSAINVTQ